VASAVFKVLREDKVFKVSKAFRGAWGILGNYTGFMTLLTNRVHITNKGLYIYMKILMKFPRCIFRDMIMMV
jgi:hypothetical protein